MDAMSNQINSILGIDLEKAPMHSWYLSIRYPCSSLKKKTEYRHRARQPAAWLASGGGSSHPAWQLASGPLSADGIWREKNVSFDRPIKCFNFWCHAPIGYLIFIRLGKDPLYDRPLAQKGTKQCANEGMRSAGGPLYDRILGQNNIKQCTRETNH